VTLLAFAAERRAAAPLLLGAVDRYLPPVGPTAANSLHAAAAAPEGTDRPIDGRTDGHRIVTETPPHTMRAVSIDRLFCMAPHPFYTLLIAARCRSAFVSL